MPLFCIVFAIASLGILTSTLPFVPAAHGMVRAFDFPRFQILAVALLVLIISVILLPWPEFWPIAGMLGAACLIQIAYVARFTPIWRRAVPTFSGEPDDASRVRLLVSNVKQSNRDYSKLSALVEKLDPDIAVFMETNQDWIDALSSVVSHYPNRMECPLDNSYGMLMVSRFPLSDSRVRFLLNKEVPSFDTMATAANGMRFRIVALHPEPPIPTRDTIGRDSEILFVAKLVRHDTFPVIVTGDLNDVAWSSTTRRFLRISRLLDPREGRGPYNTFDARFFFLRWPLDHIFHSSHFQVSAMKRQAFVGSDHFPMFYDLILANAGAENEISEPATPADLEEARELIAIEKKRDRRPPGTDWEDGST